ncbi:hypothetical protein CSB07_00970 [Candidatus Gracilibacteria bacterium]|nr:MAG: hypothetical protein CSB07_00970 [Candidatus Gracilibacteria bacterium]PIE85767.1 MAG: hypothetical protein CSA08_00240 [Candidatus Gracilibacteria bacterium]
MKKTIALTGGSTGGHIFPLLSIYNHLNEEGKYNLIWIGNEMSLEEEIAEKNNIPFYGISAGKIRRYFDLRNFYEPLKNLTGIFQGIYYIFKHNIKIVFSKGGYVSLPLCIAAKLLGKKVYIHESDTVGGVANKIIGFFANKVFYTFPNKKIDGKKHIVVGQILNPELIENIHNINITENIKLNVLVIGGSQGSKNIFMNLLKALPDLGDIKFHIILGNKNLQFENDFKAYSNVHTYRFLSQKQMGEKMKITDIALTRGGSTTLWELYYFGIHSIIIPLSNSAGNHQKENAKFFNKNFGSDILDENNNLSLEIFKLLNKYKHLRKAGLNLEGFYDALKKIEKEIS